MKVSQPDAGVKIYLNNNGVSVEPTVNQEYSVSTEDKLIFSVVPLKDNYNTTFSIQYKTTGTKDEDAPIFEKLEAHQEKVAALLSAGESEDVKMLVIAIIAGSAVLICCGICCYLKLRQSQQHDRVT